MKREPTNTMTEETCDDLVFRKIWRIKDELSAARGHDGHRLFATSANGKHFPAIRSWTSRNRRPVAAGLNHNEFRGWSRNAIAFMPSQATTPSARAIVQAAGKLEDFQLL